MLNNLKPAQVAELKSVKKLLVRQNKKQMHRSIGRWNESSIRSAIDKASQGDFTSIAQLSRSMLSDSAFSAAIKKRTWALVRSEFYMEPAGEDYTSQFIAQAIEKIWYENISEITMQQLIQNYLLFGVSCAFVEWINVEGIWSPNITILDNEFLRYDISTNEWKYRSAISEETVCPGNGNWILISEWSLGSITGFIAQLASAWLSKKYAEKDQLEYNENLINPLVVIQQRTNGIHDSQEDIDDLVGEIQDKKRDRVIYVSENKEVTVENTTASGNSTNFLDLINYADKKFQISILGGNLSSQVDAGSRAAAEVHNSTELLLTKTDASIMSTELKNQLIVHMIYSVFGKQAVKDYLCWPMWKTEPDEDLTAKSNMLSTINNIISQNGYEIENLQEILESFGIKIKKQERI